MSGRPTAPEDLLDRPSIEEQFWEIDRFEVRRLWSLDHLAQLELAAAAQSFVLASRGPGAPGWRPEDAVA